MQIKWRERKKINNDKEEIIVEEKPEKEKIKKEEEIENTEIYDMNAELKKSKISKIVKGVLKITIFGILIYFLVIAALIVILFGSCIFMMKGF